MATAHRADQPSGRPLTLSEPYSVPSYCSCWLTFCGTISETGLGSSPVSIQPLDLGRVEPGRQLGGVPYSVAQVFLCIRARSGPGNDPGTVRQRGPQGPPRLRPRSILAKSRTAPINSRRRLNHTPPMATWSGAPQPPPDSPEYPSTPARSRRRARHTAKPANRTKATPHQAQPGMAATAPNTTAPQRQYRSACIPSWCASPVARDVHP